MTITYLIAHVVCTILICKTVPSQLAEKQLDQALNITKMTAAFLNLDLEFVSRLNTWTNKTYQLNKNWLAVRKKIIQFYNSDHNLIWNNILSLNNCRLHSLPDIFDIPVFQNKLRVLDLSHNQLTTLPASIGTLQSLRYLDLSDNATLSSLPEEVRYLPSRCIVDISNCSFSQAGLKRLPDTMAQIIFPTCTTVAIHRADFLTGYRSFGIEFLTACRSVNKAREKRKAKEAAEATAEDRKKRDELTYYENKDARFRRKGIRKSREIG